MDELIGGFNENEEYLKSYWIASTEKTNYPALTEDISVDVAIVGGGIVGITTAYLLKNKGLKVAVLEASRIAEGATGFTTAKVTCQHNLIYDKLINSMGFDAAKQYAAANASSIEFIEELSKKLNINCDFERTEAYTYTKEDKYIRDIEKETEAALRLGINAKCVNELPIELEIKSAVVFENQAQFHSRKYILPIAEKVNGEGSFVFENTEIMDIERGNTLRLLSRGGNKVTAGKVVIASHYPFYDGMGLYPARLKPERSYVVAVEIDKEFPKATFISAENPTRSLRVQKDGERELVLVAGEGHKTAHGKDFNVHYSNLEKFAKNIFKVKDVAYRWSVQDYMTLDDVPYIGKLKENEEDIYVATGFEKWGMTNGTAAARIIADEILDIENPWKEVFNPSRKLNALAYGKLISLNLSVAVSYIGGKLSAGEDKIDVKKGEGKIVEIDGDKYGAYRDEEGKLHIVNTTCTHVGCELKWNNAEKSWDCPCHGSRFAYDGEILEGPATHRLNHYGEGKNKVDPNLK